VHSDGCTALHVAAYYGNRRIVRSLVAFGADVNGQTDYGCAVSACCESAWVRRPSSRRRRPCRQAPLHFAAAYGHSESVAELLLRGADGAVQDNRR
jgi:ankyrin repeat protein